MKVYRLSKQGIQAIERPAELRWDNDALDFESLELARLGWALIHGFKPRMKIRL